MIDVAIKYLAEEINEHYAHLNLGEFVKVGNVALWESGGADLQGNVVFSVVNIAEESTLKNGNIYAQQGESIGKRNPTLYLNLYIIFAYVEKDKDYNMGLTKLTKIVEFFQRQFVFTAENAKVTFPSGLEKLIIDLFSLNFEQINHLWGVLGGKYLPSVVYKMRMVSIQRSPLEQVEPIREIKTTENPF